MNIKQVDPIEQFSGRKYHLSTKASQKNINLLIWPKNKFLENNLLQKPFYECFVQFVKLRCRFIKHNIEKFFIERNKKIYIWNELHIIILE